MASRWRTHWPLRTQSSGGEYLDAMSTSDMESNIQHAADVWELGFCVAATGKFDRKTPSCANNGSGSIQAAFQ